MPVPAPASCRAALLVLALLLQGCDDIPRDARGTLEEIRGGARPLRIGWSPAEPWVRDAGAEAPQGAEPALLRAWADSIGAHIEWVRGSQAQIVAALREGVVDVGLAGFGAEDPGAGRTGRTQTYLRSDIVIGAAPGVEPPRRWEGVEIRHHQGRPEIAAAIRTIGAVPVAAAPSALEPLAAVYGAELAALGLRPAGKRLGGEGRQVATAPAENALTLALDRFLLEHSQAVHDALAAEARR